MANLSSRRFERPSASRLAELFGEPVVLLPCRRKVPFIDGLPMRNWQKLSHQTTATVPYQKALQHAEQIGVLCGGASGGLVGIDIDEPGCAGRAVTSLPESWSQVLRAHGAPGKLKFFFRIHEPLPRKQKLCDAASGAPVGDLLASSSQAIVAGIHHLSGIPYELVGDTVVETSIAEIEAWL